MDPFCWEIRVARIQRTILPIMVHRIMMLAILAARMAALMAVVTVEGSMAAAVTIDFPSFLLNF